MQQAYDARTAEAEREAGEAQVAVARVHGEVAQGRRDARAAFNARESGRTSGRSGGSSRALAKAAAGQARGGEGPQKGATRHQRDTAGGDSGASNRSSSSSSAAEAPPGAFPWHPLTASVGRGPSAQPLLGTLETLMEELELQKELAKAQQARRCPRLNDPPLLAAANSLPPAWAQAPRTASAPVLAPVGSFY